MRKSMFAAATITSTILGCSAPSVSNFHDVNSATVSAPVRTMSEKTVGFGPGTAATLARFGHKPERNCVQTVIYTRADGIQELHFDIGIEPCAAPTENPIASLSYNTVNQNLVFAAAGSQGRAIGWVTLNSNSLDYELASLCIGSPYSAACDLHIDASGAIDKIEAKALPPVPTPAPEKITSCDRCRYDYSENGSWWYERKRLNAHYDNALGFASEGKCEEAKQADAWCKGTK